MLKLADKNILKDVCYVFISGITIYNTCQNGLPLTCIFINSLISDMNEKVLKVMLFKQKNTNSYATGLSTHIHILVNILNELVMYGEGNPVH